MIRYGIRTSAVYDPLWSCPSAVLVLVCGVRADSAQRSSNNWNFIPRECRCTTYLHYTIKPWTSAHLNMSVETNGLKVRIVKVLTEHYETCNTVLLLLLLSVSHTLHLSVIFILVYFNKAAIV